MWSSYKGWNGVVCPVVMCLREHNHNRPRMRTTEREQLKVISLTCFLSRHYRTGYQNNCSSNTTVRKRKPRIWFSRWKELSGYRLLFLRVLTKAITLHIIMTTHCVFQLSTPPGMDLKCACDSTWTEMGLERERTSLFSLLLWEENTTPFFHGHSDTR